MFIPEPTRNILTKYGLRIPPESPIWPMADLADLLRSKGATSEEIETACDHYEAVRLAVYSEEPLGDGVDLLPVVHYTD